MKIPSSRFLVRLLLLLSFVLPASHAVFAQAPTITGFSPTTIGIGMPVTITGTNFTSAPSVRFNGVAGTGAVLNSSTQITVIAPGTLTPGPITVTTSSGVGTSPTNYAVTLVPVITDFTPSSGPEKRVVTINGYNMNGTGITSRLVRLNGMLVSSLSISNTSISFPIPVGATSGLFTVETNQGLATSATPFTVATAPAPANDNFANAILIGGTTGSITGHNVNATSEPGEPIHPGNAGGASVWFKWTAPTSGFFLFNPFDSASRQFGIVQGIYTGSAVNALTLVASSQTPNSVFARFGSAAALNAIAGTTYSIALDGTSGLMADFKLAWSPLGNPTVTSFSPSSGGAGQTVSISIAGTNFAPGSTVTFGGAAVHPSRINYNTATSIIISQVPFAATTGPIAVTSAVGTGTSAGSFTVTAAPPPTITSFSPTIGSPGSTVVITGTSLALGPDGPTTVVKFNGVPASVVLSSSSTSLSVHVPVGATTGPITVQTVQGTALSAASYTVTGPLPPVISSLSPTSGIVGANVTVSGSNFLGTTAVQFNGLAAAFTVNSASSIQATVPPAATSGPVTVTTVVGTAASPSPFTVLAPPTITGFSPGSGTPGTAVVIAGTEFSGASAVTINGLSAVYAVDSPTQITAFVPAALPSSGPIAVTTPGGLATSATNFTILASTLPTITSFSPTTITPRMVVTITGTNFTNVLGVAFNGLFTNFTLNSPTQITVTTPPGVTAGALTVYTANGTAVSPTNYTLSPPAIPAITNFAPTVIASGLPVVINGSGFSDVTSVTFNGASASFVINSFSQITATTPTGTLTPGPITVTTSIGSATSSGNYTLTLAPIITGITPSSGPEKRVITVTGANFSGNGITNQVLLVNGTPIGSFSRGTTTYTFAVPAGATTGPITLQTSQGFATSPMPFVVAAGPAPANDHFADAQPISGSTGFLLGNTANATKEPGEPNHANNPGGASVWFSWTAPSSGLFLFSPANLSSSQFGIIQSIYTGNDPTALTRVASGLTPIHSFPRFASAAVLDAVAGTTYRIALDGYNGLMADYRLSWGPLAPPVISNFSPASASAGQTININVNGGNFAPGATVTLGGAVVDPSRLIFQSGNQITITQIPSTSVTGPISVTTPAGSATSAASFVVAPPPAPTIASFSPSGAKVGTPVTITGTNFTGATAVLFNGVAASPFTVTGNSTIATAVPASASTGPITVTTPGGTATSSLPFTVIVLPTFTQHPQSQAAFVGSNVSFSVAVNTNGPEEYYWTKNGATILGNPSAGTATLTLNSVTPADAGEYRCVVVNNAGPATSEPAFLTVNKIPASIALAGLAPTYDGTPKAASATTTPLGLAVTLTYDGAPTPPTAAGSYAVAASIVDPTYTGSTTGTLTIAKATAVVSLEGLAQTYTGAPRIVTPVTIPAGLATTLTYAGSPIAPTDAGSYAVAAVVLDPNYTGIANATLTVSPAPSTITLAGLRQRYDGTARIVTATTTPAGLAITLTYDGQATAPVLPGHYAIVATINEANYTGTATGSLIVGTTALVRHAPTLNGGVDGSVQVLLGEPMALNGSAWVSGDLLVPGTPGVVENGLPTYAGTIDASGSEAPSNYTITLNGSAVLRHIVRRVNAPELPTVAAPATPSGTRDVSLNTSSSSPGDFTTLRNLTLNGNAGDRAVPPGTYGDFTVNGANSLILGDASSTEPTVYQLQKLTLNGNARLQLAGPVELIVAGNVTLSGSMGSPAHSGWLVLRVAQGNVTLNGSATLAAEVITPNGEVTINAGTFTGSIIADKVRINGQGLLEQPVD